MLFTILGAAGDNLACYLQYLARLGTILRAIYNTWRGLDQFCMLFTILGAAGHNLACYLQYLARLGKQLHAIYNTWRDLEQICMLFTIFGATWKHCKVLIIFGASPNHFYDIYNSLRVLEPYCMLYNCGLQRTLQPDVGATSSHHNNVY